MHWRAPLTTATLLLGAGLFSARADEFDQLDGATLAAIPTSPAAQTRTRLTTAELAGLPVVLRDSRSALMIVRTDQGNLARILAVPALRKQAQADARPLPVLLLERFATFEAPRAQTRLARGQELMLFDHFQIDLDSGQVVPEGQGGDLQFIAEGPGGPRVETIGDARIFTLASPLPRDASHAAGPSAGRMVIPTDFTGRYRLFANGQWSGTLELKANDEGAITGQFRSDQSGSTYPVTGQVAADAPQHVEFTVKFPRSRQEFDGFLWTEGKGAMAGTVTLLDHPYGFFAIREGARFAPDDADTSGVSKPEAREQPRR